MRNAERKKNGQFGENEFSFEICVKFGNKIVFFYSDIN